MGDGTRTGLQWALDDLRGGLRSALGLDQSQPELIDELLGARDRRERGGRAGGSRRASTTPRRRRRRAGRGALVLIE